MNPVASCIYEGCVRHRRFEPVPHAFEYTLFMMYLDLDELPDLLRRFPGWSNEGLGVARFRRRDHLRGHAPTSHDLSEAVRDLVQRETGRRPGGPVRLLTHLEYFGYRFNPVSFYFCFESGGRRLASIVAEINNTPWGEQHCYVLESPPAAADRGLVCFELAKRFHISPFMGMDTDYRWVFTAPSETLAVHMENRRAGAKYFDATLALRRTEITRSAMLRVLVQYPLMTTKVIAAIYWQALKLWMKRCPYYPHPHAHAEKLPQTSS